METVPKAEIEKRISRFQAQLAAASLDGAFILQNADLFYFSGTIQTAVLFVPSIGDPVLMVQKNHERAKLESSLNDVIPVKNKNRIPQVLNDFKFDQITAVGLEMDVLPANLYFMYNKIFKKAHLTIGLFCSGTPAFSGTKFFLKKIFYDLIIIHECVVPVFPL